MKNSMENNLPVTSTPGNPSPKQQSWGVVISIVVIVSMIVIGAFYVWGKRIAENQVFPTQAIAE